MPKKSFPNGAADLRRRQWLKYAGASAAAVGTLAIGARQASAGEGGTSGMPGDVLDVVIIGAGLAGLTAARDLRQAGCESFMVLEARDRVGGRTLNYNVEGGFVTEVGGQWIGPGQTAVADLARELEVGTFPSYYDGKTVILGGEGRATVDLKGTFGTDEAISSKLGKMSRDVPSGAPWTSPRAGELDRMSVGDWLVTQDIKPEDR
ncbi:NAD(P)-binding protein, partial [Burkholderia cepacia]